MQTPGPERRGWHHAVLQPQQTRQEAEIYKKPKYVHLKRSKSSPSLGWSRNRSGFTWSVPHIQLNPMLVDLKTGCVVFKDGGDVVLEIKHLLFIRIIPCNSTNCACDNNMLPVATAGKFKYLWFHMSHVQVLKLFFRCKGVLNPRSNPLPSLHYCASLL